MKNGKKAKSWFVIIIGDKERRGPFEVTQRALVLSIVCLMVVFTVMAAGSSWLFSRPFITSNNELADELADARQSIELISREKESFSKEIKRLKTEIETPREKRNDIVPDEGKGEITVASAQNDTAVEPEPFISVEEIQIAYDEGKEKLKVRCTIKSQRIDEGYVSGYVFIILNPAPDSPALCKTSPVVELAGGFPRSYEKGEKFSIARFKYIEGVFPSISDRRKYTSISILVYADDGTLRLEKELSL